VLRLLRCYWQIGGAMFITNPAAATLSNGSTDWERNMGWCYHDGAEFHIGDFNGDRKDDLLCHDINNGYKWIAYSDL
jgi:hypothetical protein